MLKLKPLPHEDFTDSPPEVDDLEQPEGTRPLFRRERNWSAIVAVSCLGLSAVNTLALIWVSFSLGGLSSRPPVMIQTKDGVPLEAKQVDYLSRSDQTLKDFVRLEMSLLWNWESFNPSVRCENPSKDLCHRIKINNRWVKIPSTLVAAQEGLERSEADNFGPNLVQEVAALIPQQVFQGLMAQQFEEHYLGEPKPIEGQPGRWSLRMRASRILTTGAGQTRAIDFNRELFLKVSDPDPAHPIKKYGLKIYAMRPLERQDYR